MTTPVITPLSISTLLLPGGGGLTGDIDIILGAPEPGRMAVVAYVGNDVGSTFNEVNVSEIILNSATLSNGQVIRQGPRAIAREGSGQTAVEVFGIPNAQLPNIAGTYPITVTTNFGVARFMVVAFEITGCPSERFSDVNIASDLTDIPAFQQWNIGLVPTVSQSLLLFFSSFKITNQTGGPTPVLSDLQTPVASILPDQIGCSAVSQIDKGCPQQFFMSLSLDQDTFLRSNVILSFQGAVAPPSGDAGGPYSGLITDVIPVSGNVTAGTDVSPIYAWTILSGGTGTFAAPNFLTTTFTPDNVGTYSIRLMATPCEGPALIVDTTVTVTAIAPTADAGGPYTAEVNTPTLLAASVIPGTDPAPIFFWSIVSGGQGTFNNVNLEDPIFTPVSIGPYVLRFTVTPNDGPVVIDTATFDSTAPPAVPPLIDAGGDYSGLKGIATALNGSIILGSDLTPVILWEVISGGQGVFSAPANTLTNFTPSQVGPYALSLTATPNDGPPVVDTANFDSLPVPPQVSAGNFGQGPQGSPIRLEGIVAYGTDPNATLLWTVLVGGTGVISNPTELITDFTPDQVLDYVLRLTVTPNDGLPVFDDVVVRSQLRLPVVDANGAYVGIVNVASPISGIVTPGSDPAPTTLWTITSAPSGGLGVFGDATSPATTFTPDTLGKYILALTVTTDDNGTISTTTASASFDSRNAGAPDSKQHNDVKMATTGGPSLMDGYLSFLRANGAASTNIVDAELEFLLARGVQMGKKNDMWYAFLTNIASLPMSANLTEMRRQWWSQGAPLI